MLQSHFPTPVRTTLSNTRAHTPAEEARMWALSRTRALAIFRGRWGVDGASVHPFLFSILAFHVLCCSVRDHEPWRHACGKLPATRVWLNKRPVPFVGRRAPVGKNTCTQQCATEVPEPLRSSLMLRKASISQKFVSFLGRHEAL